MNDKTTAPYGSWKSPVTSELIVADSIGIGDVVLHGDDIYWTEMRPADNARNVIVRRTPDGATRDITPPEYNVRTRVHEYGGGAFCVAGSDDGGSVIYFSNFTDQRIYRQMVSASGVWVRRSRSRRDRHALRRRRGLRSPPNDGLRARRPLFIVARGGQHHRRHRPGAWGQSLSGIGCILLLKPAHQSGRLRSGMAVVEPPKHALGRLRAVGCGTA